MTDPTSQGRLARLLLQIGCAALVMDKTDAADSIFDAVRTLRPDMPELELLPVMVKIHTKQFDQAAQALQYIDGDGATQLMAACQIMLGAPGWETHAEYLVKHCKTPGVADSMRPLLQHGDDIAADTGEVSLPSGEESRS